jgi:hypothetical protein
MFDDPALQKVEFLTSKNPYMVIGGLARRSAILIRQRRKNWMLMHP